MRASQAGIIAQAKLFLGIKTPRVAMLKKLLLLPLFLLNFQLIAMEKPEKPEKHVVHTPKVKKEIAKSIDAQADRSFAADTLMGTIYGGGSPWALSALLGIGCGEGLAKITGSRGGDSLVGLGVWGGLGIFVGAIPSLILTIPLAAVGTVGGLGYATFNQIADAVNDSERRRLIALNMYQWISVVKAGRLNIRAELQKHENNGSLKATIESMLNDEETFKRYFGETDFRQNDLIENLSKVDSHQDNYDNMFKALSNIMKTPKLKDQEWQQLEAALINFKDKNAEFPELSAEDIKEYLYVSVYFFTLEKGSVKWLKLLIS